MRYLVCPVSCHHCGGIACIATLWKFTGTTGCMAGIGPITNLRPQVGTLKDIKDTIRDACQVELFHSSENYVNDFTIVNMSCFVSTLIERDMDEYVIT